VLAVVRARGALEVLVVDRAHALAQRRVDELEVPGAVPGLGRRRHRAGGLLELGERAQRRFGLRHAVSLQQRGDVRGLDGQQRASRVVSDVAPGRPLRDGPPAHPVRRR
jgi:hypothetical protein